MFNKKAFNSCIFNPLSDEPMLEAYPRLHEIISPEWIDEPHFDNVLRYTVMIYDPATPLILAERDLYRRKSKAAELAGIDLDNEEFLTHLYNCDLHYLPDLSMRYLMRFAKSKEWAAICAFEFTFWESIKQLLDPIQGKGSKEVLDSVQKKSAIKAEIDLDIGRLDGLYRRFWGEDEQMFNKAKKRATPESMAIR